MKRQIFLIAIIAPFLFMLTSCDEDSYDAAYYDDEEFYEDSDAYLEEEDMFQEDEGTLTEEDCYEDEIWDPETQSCFIDIVCEDDAECDLILQELYGEEELADLEFFAMTEADCLPGESYDPEEQACYIECDTDAECEQLADEIYVGLDVYFSDAYNGRSDVPSSSQATDLVVLPDDLTGGDPELPSIARYIVDDSLNIQLAGIDDNQPDAQINQERHLEIWAFLRRILPSSIMKSDVSEYHIFSDGTEAVLAYVSPLTNDATQWLIGIDITDAGTSGKINTRDFVHTTIHEFAHILTLEDDQVPPDTSLSREEIEAGEESDIARACTTFYTGEGCALANAYISQFFDKFWADVYYNEFQDVLWTETDEDYEDALYEFYDAHQDWFVTEYAATNPGEDIAESFTYFVLQEKPAGDTIADQKVRFFYNYPTLVAMRTHIRSELARMK